MIFEGKHVRLEPLTHDHFADLWVAAPDKRIWELAHGPSTPEEMDDYVRHALKEESQGRAIPFVIREVQTGRIVGSTRLKEVDLTNKCCELGSTWFIPKLWRSGANRESKLLLLTHAFEEMKMQRVGFMVGAQNTRSRDAMEKLGATQEGVLRSRQLLPSGEKRDFVVFSILDSEWPEIKIRLRAMLGA